MPANLSGSRAVGERLSMSQKRRKRPFHRDRFTEKYWAPYALAIGQASLAWNAFHESLASIFVLLLDRQLEEHEEEDRDPRPIAVWRSAKFDRPKRQMLRAVIETERKDILEAFPHFAADLTWVLDQAD